jgi:MATE family multidrug resistance protein
MTTVTTMAPPQAWRAPTLLRAEMVATIRLAVPLALTQLGQVAIHGTEVLLLGRLGAAKLAAVTLAWPLFFACFIFACGVVQATAPLIATARGARRPREVRRAVRQGIWVTVAVSLPCSVLLWHARPLLEGLGQDPALLDDTETYLRAAAFGLPLGVGFVVLRNLASAYDRTRPIMVVMAVAVVVNVAVSWALIFGHLGLPRLEVLGAGIAASSIWALMFLALLGWCVLARPFRRMRLLGRFWRPDWAKFRQIWRLGLPIGAAMLLETVLFGASAYMVGRFGTAELAAHQVTLQLASMTFMVPLGIGIAATIRIGLAAGAGDAPAIRRAGWVAAALGAGFMTLMAVAFWTVGADLAALFFDPADPSSGAALAVVAVLVKAAALFQLGDGLQVIGISALRGLKDTAVPMWLAGLGYGLVGLPACLLLGFGLGLGVLGVWLGLVVALTVVAAAMLLRLAALTASPALERRLGRQP